MEIVSERTYIQETFAVAFHPHGKRLDDYGGVKDPDKILSALERWVNRGVRRQDGIRGPIKLEVRMDYMTGVPLFIAKCRAVRDVPEQDRERMQEWMNQLSQDRIVAGLGKYKVSSNG